MNRERVFAFGTSHDSTHMLRVPQKVINFSYSRKLPYNLLYNISFYRKVRSYRISKAVKSKKKIEKTSKKWMTTSESTKINLIGCDPIVN